MNSIRPPKGWTLVGTNDLAFGVNETREEKLNKDLQFQNLIRKVPIRSVEEMKKEADVADLHNQLNRDELVLAYKDGKLRSQKLIKKAQRILKETTTS